MINSITGSLKKYVDFQSRATRTEFWSFVVFFYVVSFIAGGINGLTGTDIVGTLAVTAIFLPYLAVAVRRLNDVGKSGWFILVPIYNFILLCTPSKPEVIPPTTEQVCKVSKNLEPEKRYLPIPKPLADMTVEERRVYANQLADFILQNENLTPPGLSEELIEVESGVIDTPSRFKKAVALVRKPFTFLNRATKKAAGALAVIAVLLGGTGVYLGIGPYLNYNNTDPSIDGFVPPRSIEGLVDQVQASTVTVFCDYAEDNYSQGSGWAISLPIDQQDKYQTTLITNHHVIKKCLDGTGKVVVKTLGGKEYSAYVDRWDVKNDLAVIGTVAKLEPLSPSEWMPYAGYWVMAVGTADGFEGSVAFGNVLNTTDTDVLITAAISHGNSGGPLVDNEGNVVGTNSWGATGEQYNGAVSLDAMCVKIMKCQGKYFWSRD